MIRNNVLREFNTKHCLHFSYPSLYVLSSWIRLSFPRPFTQQEACSKCPWGLERFTFPSAFWTNKDNSVDVCTFFLLWRVERQMGRKVRSWTCVFTGRGVLKSLFWYAHLQDESDDRFLSLQWFMSCTRKADFHSFSHPFNDYMPG